MTLLRLRADFYRAVHPQPGDVLLVIEVADATVEPDRRWKVPLYARAGLREAWLVDLNAERLEIYGEAGPAGYPRPRVLAHGEAGAPGAFPTSRSTSPTFWGEPRRPGVDHPALHGVRAPPHEGAGHSAAASQDRVARRLACGSAPSERAEDRGRPAPRRSPGRAAGCSGTGRRADPPEAAHRSPAQRLIDHAVDLLRERARDAIVSVSDAVRLGPYSLPRPDVTVCHARQDRYRSGPPSGEDVVLAVDVWDGPSDVTHGLHWPVDARWRIPIAWLIDPAGGAVRVGKEPSDRGYASTERYGSGETLSLPVPFHDVVLEVNDILG